MPSCFGLSWDSPSLDIEITYGAVQLCPVYLNRVTISEYVGMTGVKVGKAFWALRME